MEFKALSTRVKEITDRTVTGFFAVVGNVDDGQDRLIPGAFAKTLQERRSRVRHLWMHDASQPPTAAISDIKEVGLADVPAELIAQFPMAQGALQVTRKYLQTPRAEEIFQGIATGAISEMSFGYDAIKYDYEESRDLGMMIRNLREVRLWDTSDVNWGMNPATLASKVAFKDSGIAPESEVWEDLVMTDEDFESLTEEEKGRILEHFTWEINPPAKSLSNFLFQHHRLAEKGVGPAVWEGVKASMSGLMTGAKGLDLSARARWEIYDHLAKHYQQFGKEAPEFKVVELGFMVSQLQVTPELKVGRVLSARNFQRLEEALAMLQEVLLAAEPPKSNRALTDSILRRLAIAERESNLVY